MASGYPPQGLQARNTVGRARPARPDDAELLAPPEVDPVQLSRSMFSQPAPRPAPAPLTNHHLKKVARLDAAATSGDAAGARGGGGGRGSGGASAARIRSARSHRSGRSVAASSIRGGRAAFSVVSDEEVIDVDGEPTTLADEDMDLPPSPVAEDEEYGRGGAGGPGGGGGGPRHRGPGRGGALGMSGIAGLAGDEYGGPDPLEELEADTPAVRLAEVTADLEVAMQSSNKDPWALVHMAQLALGHAKVAWRTMPVAVREEPLLLAKAHFSLARAYQGLGCDRQASDHGKQALAAIPKEVADTEAARALRTEVQVMRAEALLSSAGVAGVPPEAACNQARKALVLLVKAAGLQEPVAWTSEEVEDNDLGGVQRSTIDSVSDAGLVALMAQSHGVLAESKLKEVDAADANRKSSLRSAEEAASRLERRTDRGDALYSAEQLEKYKGQVQAFRDEADSHQADMVRLAGEAERSFDAAMYCLNHVIDVEGSRLEESLGREGKLAHPTFQALWRRALDFCSGMGIAYAHQRKDSLRLNILNDILSAFAQYGSCGWLPPARHIQALKDKGALLVDRRDYEGATACYEELTDVVTELYESDPVRKELQVAEVLKLRGDVALASGDFRTAQHKFNQALEFYQRHLGAQSPVAQDLLHRIDEVKGYLADTRVMGRLASLPGRASASAAAAASAASTGGMSAGPASAVAASGGGGIGTGARPSPAPSVTASSVRSSGISRPPPLAGAAASSHRTSATASAPAPVKTSFEGDDGAAAVVAAAGGGASAAGPPSLSAASTPYSQRAAALSVPTTAASTPAGAHRGSGAVGAAASRPSNSSFRPSGDGFDGAAAPPAPASVAGSLAGQRRGSGSEIGGGHGWPPVAPAAASPAPSIRSYRSADVGGGVAASALSQRSGAGSGLDDGGYGRASSPAAQSHRSGYGGGDGGYARAASPAAQSQRSGYGGAASPAALSHRSGYGGGDDAYGNTAATPATQSQRSGYGGAASPAALSQRSGYGGGDDAYESAAPTPAAQSQRSGHGGAALPAALSHRSGYGGGDDAYGSGAVTPAAQSQRSGYGGAASPAALSHRSGYGGGDDAYGSAAPTPAAQLQSQRSGYGGAASPAAQSHRSGYGGDGGYGGYGAARASVSQSLRSTDFGVARGYGSTAGSQPRASGALEDDFADEDGGVAEGDDGGMYDNDRASSVSPSIASANRRLAVAASGDLRASGAASPSARSQRSGAGYDGGLYGGAGSTAALSHRSLAGFEGGLGSPAALSQRSGFAGSAAGGGASAYDGAASPTAMSQRSGFGGGAVSGYGGSHYGLSAALMSQRSGEFGQGLGKVNSRSSLSKSQNDPMEF